MFEGCGVPPSRAYKYGAVPLVGVTVIDPLLAPAQLGAILEAVAARPALNETVRAIDTTQPPASCTVMI